MQNLLSFGQLRIDARLARLREQAKSGRDPSTPDETLNYLLYTIQTLRPSRILEIGTGEGLSGAAMLFAAKDARLTSIECVEERFFTAKKNFADLGLSARADLIFGDAGEVLPHLNGAYDLIFLDGPKAQYLNYFPCLKALLRSGGVLFADDVLLYGWVDGREPTPAKRRPLVEKIRAYLRAVLEDPDFITSVLPLGEGVAVSVRL